MDLKEIAAAGSGRHPWERHRFETYAQILARHVPPSATRVLDVGAGDGFFAQELAARWPTPLAITCWDSGYGDAPSVALPAFEQTPVQPPTRFDIVLMLDVAEHVADDDAFVRAIVAQNIAPDGRLLFAVPAWPALWTNHDERLGHERRYTPRTATQLLTGAGLRIVECGSLFPSLVPIRAVQMLRERYLKVPVPGADSVTHGGPLAWALDGVLRADRRVQQLARRLAVTLPGLSWWALCTR